MQQLKYSLLYRIGRSTLQNFMSLSSKLGFLKLKKKKNSFFTDLTKYLFALTKNQSAWSSLVAQWIWCCRCSGMGHCCGVGSIFGQGTSIWCRFDQIKKC